MKKRILIISTVLTIIILIGSIYVNQVVLSPKVKNLIADALEEATGKKVILGSIRFNIFKGIVLKDLIIYDGNRAVINAKSASCIFLIHPLLKKEVVMASVRFDTPELYIERRPDGSVNIADLFSHQNTAEGRYRLVVRSIAVRNADVVLRDYSLDPSTEASLDIARDGLSSPSTRAQDSTLSYIEGSRDGEPVEPQGQSRASPVVGGTRRGIDEPFGKEIKGLALNAYLTLPAKIRFDCDFSLPGEPAQKINLKGEYLIPQKEFRSDVAVTDFEPKELSAYFEKLDFSLPGGRVDAKINVSSKEGMIEVSVDGRTKRLLFAKEGLTALADSNVEASAEYRTSDKTLTYSGSVNISDMELNGVEAVKRIENIKGDFLFDNTGLSCDNLSARTLGLALSGRLFLADFANPILNIEANTGVGLPELENILKDPFKIKLPVNIAGEGKLFLTIQYNPFRLGTCQAAGYLDTEGSRIAFDPSTEAQGRSRAVRQAHDASNGAEQGRGASEARRGIDKARPALEDVTGRFEFTPNQLSWAGLTFRYQGTKYETYGTVTNFDSPGVQMTLASEDLTLDAIFSAGERRLIFSKLEGRYLNSRFSAQGALDTAGDAKGLVDFSGTSEIDLADLKKIFKGSKDKLDKAKLSGTMRADFSLKGDMSDIKRYSVDARFSSDSISAYGLKSSAVSLDYKQESGSADISSLRAKLYGGELDGVLRIDLTAKEIPYSVTAELAGVKLEQLKNDAGFKDKTIAGSVRMKIKLKGSSDDLSRLSGSGRIDIANGNLWQLNLFKGLGVLLFTSDFTNVIFTKGGFDFIVKDKAVSTDNFELSSHLLDLYGHVMLNFQNSIDALLKAEFTDEAIDSRAVRPITTAIGRYSLIDIKGTLRDPKYHIKADVPSIVEDLAEAMLGQ
jgi:uncharacterized protein involved in outer membrane biogenesis